MAKKTTARKADKSKADGQTPPEIKKLFKLDDDLRTLDLQRIGISDGFSARIGRAEKAVEAIREERDQACASVTKRITATKAKIEKGKEDALKARLVEAGQSFSSDGRWIKCMGGDRQKVDPLKWLRWARKCGKKLAELAACIKGFDQSATAALLGEEADKVMRVDHAPLRLQFGGSAQD